MTRTTTRTGWRTLRLRSGRILRARVLQVGTDVGGKCRGAQHTRRRPPSENPAAKRKVVADIEGKHDAAVGYVAQRLGRVPDAGAHVRRDVLVERHLYV